MENKKEHSLRESIIHISKHFNLTESEKKERISSGYHTVIDNRVGWARTHLRKAEVIKYTRRGHFRITKRGLKLLEKKAYRSVFNDGLWDIFIGLLILNLGIGPLFILLFNLPEFLSIIISSIFWNIMALLIFILGKKYITIPRVGYVKFGPERRSKQLKLKIFLMIVFIVNVILFILPFTGIMDYAQIQPLLITLLLGFGIFTFPFSIIAYYLDFTRLYYYSFSVGVGFFLTELLTPIIAYPLNNFFIFGTIGLIIVLIGLYYFIHFLKKYSLSKEEVP